MYTINNDNIVESLEKMANDIQYPPLNGGPTKDDILAMLRGASAVIAEQESYIDDQDEATDRAEELESAVAEAFDAKAYDTHEDDARRRNKLLLHHMESSWQDENAEAQILNFYESLPHVGIFHPKDFNHFTTKQ